MKCAVIHEVFFLPKYRIVPFSPADCRLTHRGESFMLSNYVYYKGDVTISLAENASLH